MGTVGIVIPCFNRGSWILEAVESASTQVVPAAQIVIVDDGSTDSRTLATLETLRGRPSITVLRQDNAGPAAARNRGIAALDTDYVLPLDSDDRLSPDTVGIVQRTLDADADERIGIVMGKVKLFGNGQGVRPHQFRGIGPLLRGNSIPNTSGFRRSDWEKVGGYPEDLRLAEDWAFWLRILALGRGVAVKDEVFYEYRLSEESLTSRVDVRDVVKAQNFTLKDSWSHYSQHPEVVISELTLMRERLAHIRRRYRFLIQAKNALKSLAQRLKSATAR